MDLIKNTPFPDIFCEPEKKTHIFQGDIIKYINYINTKQENLGFIILSNSCDLENLKNKTVISIAPLFPFNFVFDDMLSEALNRTKKKLDTLKSSKEVIEHFTNLVSQYIYDESNYKKKYTFFISPLSEFDNKPTIAHIEHITSIKITELKIILQNRIISIKPPWREKLAFKTGYIYNRIATYTPEFKDIKKWWISTYKEILEIKEKELKKIHNFIS